MNLALVNIWRSFYSKGIYDIINPCQQRLHKTIPNRKQSFLLFLPASPLTTFYSPFLPSFIFIWGWGGMLMCCSGCAFYDLCLSAVWEDVVPMTTVFAAWENSLHSQISPRNVYILIAPFFSLWLSIRFLLNHVFFASSLGQMLLRLSKHMEQVINIGPSALRILEQSKQTRPHWIHRTWTGFLLCLVPWILSLSLCACIPVCVHVYVCVHVCLFVGFLCVILSSP